MNKYHSRSADGHCLFCEIVARTRTTPGIYWENDDFIAFLSIFPNTEGFTVLASKNHLPSDILSLDKPILDGFIAAMKICNEIIKNHFADVGRVGVIFEGLGVDHAHVKLVPMHGTGHLKHGEWRQHVSNAETFFPTYAGYIISADGPRNADENISKLAKILAQQSAASEKHPGTAD